MNNEKILRKAVEKAEKNGWKIPEWYRKFILSFAGKWKEGEINLAIESSSGYLIAVTDLLFSPSFGKAFWREEYTKCDCGGEDDCKFEPQPRWVKEQHLLLDEIQKGRCPVQYLAKFL